MGLATVALAPPPGAVGAVANGQRYAALLFPSTHSAPSNNELLPLKDPAAARLALQRPLATQLATALPVLCMLSLQRNNLTGGHWAAQAM